MVNGAHRKPQTGSKTWLAILFGWKMDPRLTDQFDRILSPAGGSTLRYIAQAVSNMMKVDDSVVSVSRF